MEIYQYTPEFLSPITQFYNLLTAEVPHCYPVNEEEFALAMQGVSGHTDDNDDDLEEETAFVVLQNDSVQAFVHVGFFTDGDDEDRVGVIQFLGYKRGERNAGQKILENAESYLKAHKVSQIIAFTKMYRYNFYGYDYTQLSDKLDHIHALFGINEYRRNHGQVFLEWKNFIVEPAHTDLPVTLKVDWKEGSGKLPNCFIKAYIDNNEVGQCDNVSCGQYSSQPDLQDWFYTHWIGVEDDFQGQGIGKYLLQYTLHEMHKVGYRHASLSTDWDNNRALLFYSNLGYRAVDWTYTYEKVLSDTSDNTIAKINALY